jgi:beta-phosphoglucomutase-like phosphatase (HAD superfamily)
MNETHEQAHKRRTHPAMVGLPDGVRACPFDLDGVLTQTAKVHAAAWKEMFDGFLRERAAGASGPLVPFDPVADYDEYVDGMPRYAGAHSFLAARACSKARPLRGTHVERLAE